MPDLSRVDLDIDPIAVALVDVDTLTTEELEDESLVFHVPNDSLTFFVVQNDDVALHMQLTAINRRSRVRTPAGSVETAPLVIDIGEGDDALYAFRLPPEIYNGVDGLVTFTRVASVGKIWCGRFPRSESYRGPVVAVDGDEDIRVAVSTEPVEIPLDLIDPEGGLVMRKGSMSVYFAQNPDAEPMKLALQTSSIGAAARNFGKRFGVMGNADDAFGALAFCVHPVTLPDDSELVAFVRPVGAYEGVTGEDAGAVFLLVEDDTDINLTRLDLDV